MFRPLVQGLFVYLSVAVSALHFKHLQTNNTYDSEAYLKALEAREDTFLKDITMINLQIADMKMVIENSTTSQNEKLAALNEGLADERDSLYNIETYLDRPF